MEGLMNFGCFLAEEERSEIDFSGGMGDVGRKLGPSSSSEWSCCQLEVRLAVPYYFLEERITFN